MVTKVKALGKDAGDKLYTGVAGSSKAEAWRQPVKGGSRRTAIAQEVMNSGAI